MLPHDAEERIYATAQAVARMEAQLAGLVQRVDVLAASHSQSRQAWISVLASIVSTVMAGAVLFHFGVRQ